MVKAMDIQLQRKNNSLISMKDKLDLLNPKAQLNRGYALAIDKNEKVIYGSNQVGIDEVFQLRLASGKLKARVLEKKEK